jgi:hypothetical protein
MSAEHIAPGSTRSEGVGRQRRRVAFALAAVAALAVPAFVGLWRQVDQRDALEGAIVDLGFYPIRPPTTLRGPGSFYHVDPAGNIAVMVCEADHVLVGSQIDESPTTLITAETLQKADYAIDAGVVEQINAKLTSKRVQSVHYELSDVKVLEIPRASLVGIARRLISNPDCDQAIKQLVDSRELVCQGASVLLASASYAVKVDTDRAAEGTVDVGADELALVRDVLKQSEVDSSARVVPKLGAQTQGDATGSSSKLVSGDNLYYGIKLNPLCMAPAQATRPWRLPRNLIERWAFRFWQLSPV